MNSFYGGPSGQSFEIQEVFKNKVAMYADLQKRWQSSLGVGSFVFIAYGLPGQGEYDVNKAIDINEYSQTYNSTLWQKIYIENTVKDKTALSGIETIFASEDYGLGYRLIASCTGNTPQFEVLANILAANEKPFVTIDNTDVDSPKLTFHLPHSYEFVKGDISVVSLDVNELPKVTLDPVSTDDPYTLKFGFSIPKSQVITQVKLDPYLDANADPIVRLETDSTKDPDASINNPVLYFAFPKTADFDTFLHGALDPGAAPQVSLDQSDPNNLVFHFSLPTSQKMKDPVAATLAPAEEPQVEDIGTIREPQLKFSLPRAVKFYYGSLLGESSAGIYTLTDSEVLAYAKGDYYINEETGFMYLVTDVTTSQATFQYVACLQAPLPQVSTSWISPFDDSGNRVGADITESYDNPTEQTGWKLDFSIPLNPKFEIGNVEFVGAAERDKSKVDLVVKDKDTMQFSFTLAQGSRVYADMGAPAINDAAIGDIYIDSEAGTIYEFTSSGWSAKTGTIKGPVGSSLRVVSQLTYTSDDADDKLASIADLIENDYGVPASDEIIAVTYQQLDAAKEIEQEISYWYFYTRETSTATTGEWGRALLTGGVANLIENEYVADGDTNKAYSVSYVNALIDDVNEDNNVKVFSKTQVREMLSWGRFSDLIPTT